MKIMRLLFTSLHTGINRCLNSSSHTSTLVIVLSSLFGALVTVIILIAFSITCCCVKSSLVARGGKSKSAIDKESRVQMQNEENQSKLIYEEINSIEKIPSGDINTQENSAYGNPRNIVVSNV